MGIPYAEVIGDPIAHSKSPLIHRFWLEKLGIEGDYRATRVGSRELGAFLRGRRGDKDWRGCNVTMPLKTSIADEIDCLTSQAERAGAVNCVTASDERLVGTNTDMAGIETALFRFLSHQRACIVGAGGAARAAVAALSGKSVRDIRIVARRPDRAKVGFTMALEAPKFFPFAQAAQAMEGAEIIINASPLGMAGQPPMPKGVLLSLDSAHPDAYVLDLVYVPVETPFLMRARSLGYGWADGLDALIGQAKEAFRLFFGGVAPVGHNAELRELLTR